MKKHILLRATKGFLSKRQMLLSREFRKTYVQLPKGRVALLTHSTANTAHGFIFGNAGDINHAVKIQIKP